MLIPRGRTAYTSQDANCHVNWRGVGSGLVHVIHNEVTHAAHRHDLDSVLYGRVLVLAPQNEHCRTAGELSKGGPSSRCVKQSHQSKDQAKRHDNASASGSPAASEYGPIGRCQSCAPLTIFRHAPQCRMQPLAANHLPLNTVGTSQKSSHVYKVWAAGAGPNSCRSAPSTCTIFTTTAT